MHVAETIANLRRQTDDPAHLKTINGLRDTLLDFQSQIRAEPSYSEASRLMDTAISANNQIGVIIKLSTFAQSEEPLVRTQRRLLEM
jgi:hypothetical protein